MVELGMLVRDRVSGFKGIAVARTEWLNGCVRVTIQPKLKKDGSVVSNETFDIEQLEILSDNSKTGFAVTKRSGGPCDDKSALRR